MTRKSTTERARHLLTVSVLMVAVNGFCGPAGAESRRTPLNAPVDHGTLSTPPVMAIVSMKDQRISLYDANGGAMQARVSTGRFDYETPVGTYSILQKNKDHYSNVYDDAAMPFMQRITWSGIALHQGDLPGYPASHGCVRLPQSFASQIFPLTKIGMRVIVARDNVAPVSIAHPNLLKPGPLASATAIPAAYEEPGAAQPSGSVFQADVSRWPQRQTELDALKAVAADLSAKAELTKPPVEDLKAVTAGKTKTQAAAAKILRAAEKAKRIADDKSARAARELAAAKDPAKLKKWEVAKNKADAAVISTTVKFAKANLDAQAITNERQRRRADRTLRALDRAKLAAERQAARAARDLVSAQSPERFKKQELTAAKTAETARLANEKHAAAAAAMQSAEAGLQTAKQDLAKADEIMQAAIKAARDAERKTFPVSIFVSLKSQMIYVRQGHEAIIEMPIAIADPSRPIGTHVFTAVDYQEGAEDLRWTAVSMARRPWNQVAQLKEKSKRRDDVQAEPYLTDAAIALDVLDRVTIPAEIREQFSASFWPGSSLIVSDEGLSKETGNSTDFIVLISGEPQGGIKRRPKPAPAPLYYNPNYTSFYSGNSYYGANAYVYDRYGRPIRVRQKPKPLFSWW